MERYVCEYNHFQLLVPNSALSGAQSQKEVKPHQHSPVILPPLLKQRDLCDQFYEYSLLQF